MLRARVALIAVVMLAGIVMASVASAGPSEATRRAARSMAEAGLTLYEAKRWQEAYDLFRQANAQVPAPTFVLYMAHCKKQLGGLVEARRLYADIANAQIPDGAPKQFEEAKQQASAELEALERRVPSISVIVVGEGADEALVTIDGEPLPDAERAHIRLDPGDHVIAAVAPGADPVRRSILLGEGDSQTVQLDLAPLFVGDDEDETSGTLVPAAIAYSIGAVGLALGIITGVMSINEVDDLKSRCRPDNHCPAADRSQADTADALATASTIGFVVAGVGVVAGTALLIFRPAGGSGHSSAATVRIGPGSVSLRGRF